mmetsp:Transcript_861/g.2266  ORF Transcript_861/g.2266 Transcript_861/m.2266 type:complete len:130 (-) Transcript_861:1093-1482(-)
MFKTDAKVCGVDIIAASGAAGGELDRDKVLEGQQGCGRRLGFGGVGVDGHDGQWGGVSIMRTKRKVMKDDKNFAAKERRQGGGEGRDNMGNAMVSLRTKRNMEVDDKNGVARETEIKGADGVGVYYAVS